MKPTSPFLDQLREYRNRTSIDRVKREFHKLEFWFGASLGFGIAVVLMAYLTK